MKYRPILLFAALAVVSAQAGIIYNDYSAAPVAAAEGFSISWGIDGWNPSDTFLSFHLDGGLSVASGTDSPSNNTFLRAWRGRSVIALITSRLEEGVEHSSDMTSYMSIGETVDAAATFSAGALAHAQGVSDRDIWDGGYIGLRIDDGEGGYRYGWAEIATRLATDRSGTDSNLGYVEVRQYAIQDTSGVPIEIGVIPEPASVLLLLAGGGLIGFIRRVYPRI